LGRALVIPYGQQAISDDDIKAVIEVLKSDFLTQGPVVPEFEQGLCDYTGASHAVATNSATSALHLACLSLGLGFGDILWTTPITFVASANCALFCGATVDFVDIDPITYNLSVDALRIKLEQAEKAGKLPKVLVPVHLCGLPCDMEEIGKLAEQYGFSVIEDASHAIGGRYQDEPIGNCRYSDITIFSFHPVKIITTGEGGVALTNDADLADHLALLRSHGVTRDEKLMNQKPDGPWYYQQIDLGFNYRMTDIQAALGLSQMQRLDEIVTRRHEIAGRYDKLLEELPVKISKQHPDKYSALHLYVIRLQLDEIEKTHAEVFESLREAGIGVNLHYIPVYHHPYYKKMGFNKGYCVNAENYYAETISLPIYPTLNKVEQNKVISSIKLILQHNKF
jgi:UDP-4-amino-4,6-dideoxy-N-acetyl-beta-L-altrosamine transaminase